jgi:hypothetical protein
MMHWQWVAQAICRVNEDVVMLFNLYLKVIYQLESFVLFGISLTAHFDEIWDVLVFVKDLSFSYTIYLGLISLVLKIDNLVFEP